MTARRSVILSGALAVAGTVLAVGGAARHSGDPQPAGAAVSSGVVVDWGLPDQPVTPPAATTIAANRPAQALVTTRVSKRPAPPDPDRPIIEPDAPETVASWFAVALLSWRADDPTRASVRTRELISPQAARSIDAGMAVEQAPPQPGLLVSATVTGCWRTPDPASRQQVTVAVTQQLLTPRDISHRHLEVDVAVTRGDGGWLVAELLGLRSRP